MKRARTDAGRYSQAARDPAAATGRPTDLARLRALVEDELQRLDVGAPDDLGGLAEAIRYPLLAGGKRLRPVLCLATAEALGLDVREALPAALALELVHTFSLVHDDLPALDDDDLRRGRPTTHVRYGEDVAILAGDALLNAAFAVLAGGDGPAERRLDALAELARAVGPAGMIGGQYLDVRAADGIDEAGLRRLHRLKTGALIEASVGCAVALAGRPEPASGALRAFAAEVGLLFQIVDDVLDATGTDDALGKRAGADARRGRRTYVTVLGLEPARERAEAAYAGALEALERVPGATAALRELCELVARRDR
jgi:geranylgeranyl diphosphate synthase type II